MSQMSKTMLLGVLCTAAWAMVAQGPAAAAAPGVTTPQRAVDQNGQPLPERGVQQPLVWREVWKRTPGPVEHPVTQDNIANPNLELKLYGPSGKDIQFNGGEGVVPFNPAHLWTGICEQTCGAAFRDKNNYYDLAGLAKIYWLVKISGLHRIHPIIKLANGDWLLGEHEDGTEYDLHPAGFTFSETRWIKLDVDKLVTHGRWVDKPDLTKVDEIGFTDLMPGSGHGDGGYSDLGWIEVYAKAVPRQGR